MASNILSEEPYEVATATSTPVINPATHPAAGESIIVSGSFVTKTRSLSSVTDDAGNTYVVVCGSGASGEGSAWLAFCASSLGTVTQITLHLSGTSKVEGFVVRVTGLSGVVNAFDADPKASGSSAGEALTTTARCLLFCTIGSVSTATGTSGVFTFLGDQGGAGLHNGIAAIELDAGSNTCTFTLSAAAVSSMAVAAFELAGGATVNLDLGAVPSPAATHGIDLLRTRLMGIGHVPSAAAARGVDLTATVGLALGAVPAGAMTWGLDLTVDTGIITLDLGHVPSPAAAHGVDLTMTTALALGHVPSSAAAHGADLARTTGISLAHVASAAAAHGVDLSNRLALALGHVPSPAALHGLGITATRLMDIGHVPSAAQAFGVDLAVPVLPTVLMLVHLLDPDELVDVLSDAIRVRCYDNSVISPLADPELLALVATLTRRVIL